MKRVVITGGSGKAGRATVAHLLDRGYDAINVDTAASPDPDEPTLIADLTKFDQALEAIAGADAVVHLAAIPAPNILPDATTFHINMSSTYNVFAAAARMSLARVVWASSETLIGVPLQDNPPDYAPIDENLPARPQTHYALSKLAGETIGEQFSRWSGVPFTALRFSNIMEAGDYARFPEFWDDPGIRAWNLWGYVDAEDVAQSVRVALESKVQGAEAFLIAAGDTCMKQPSRDLMEKVFPNVPLREGAEGHRTLLSVAKAQGLLGYEPARSWRDHLEVKA